MGECGLLDLLGFVVFWVPVEREGRHAPKTENRRKREETRGNESNRDERSIERPIPTETHHRRGRNACMHEGRSPQCSCSGSLALWLGSGSGSRSHLFFFRSVFPTCAHEVARHVLRVCNASRSASRRARGKGGYLTFHILYIYIFLHTSSPPHTRFTLSEQ